MEEEVQEFDEVEVEAEPPKNLVEAVRQHRYSAIVNGVSMGMGAVFLLFGIILPMTLSPQLVYGLFLIISGILMMATGAIVEAYQLGKLRSLPT